MKRLLILVLLGLALWSWQPARYIDVPCMISVDGTVMCVSTPGPKPLPIPYPPVS